MLLKYSRVPINICLLTHFTAHTRYYCYYHSRLSSYQKCSEVLIRFPHIVQIFFYLAQQSPPPPSSGPGPTGRPPFTKFLDHTQRRTAVGSTPLDEWSARCRDLYLTTHNAHNIHTSMPPVGFKPTISAGERPHIYALDRAATGTGYCPNMAVF